VGEKIGYLGVGGDRKTVRNVPSGKDVYGISDIYIYEPGRIYLKNEATFAFDQGWELILSGGIAGSKKLGEMNF
jgi:hypothetical protein